MSYLVFIDWKMKLKSLNEVLNDLSFNLYELFSFYWLKNEIKEFEWSFEWFKF